MTSARPLRDVFADLLGDAGGARPDPAAALAAAGHPDLPPQLVAEAVVSYADTAPVEVAEHLAPYVTAHSGVPPVEEVGAGEGDDDLAAAGDLGRLGELFATAPAVPDADLDGDLDSDREADLDAPVAGRAEGLSTEGAAADLDGLAAGGAADDLPDGATAFDFGGGAGDTGAAGIHEPVDELPGPADAAADDGDVDGAAAGGPPVEADEAAPDLVPPLDLAAPGDDTDEDLDTDPAADLDA
jgi:hypothetical protein